VVRILTIGVVLAMSGRAGADGPGTLVSDRALVNALALDHTLLDEASLRVVEVYSDVSACGGTIDSCPDVELFVTFVSGDLGERPVVHRVGAAKGWEIVGRTGTASLRWHSALPEANIDFHERNAWKPTAYRVDVKDGEIKVRRE
jgi:hypothetical protein